VVTAAEMHAAVAPAAEMAAAMTSAEMSAAAVTPASAAAMTSASAAAMTSASAASCQGRIRQHGSDNQDCNSNAGLRHGICSGFIALLK
jgi:hypothetical protein